VNETPEEATRSKKEPTSRWTGGIHLEGPIDHKGRRDKV
jgi:hypothetical protein